MLKCSTSTWSANLANLGADLQRVEPYSERFHVDVTDGHYSPVLLFFPDLVKAVRPLITVPVEVHLMTTDPSMWVEPFVEAGANGIIFNYDTTKDPRGLLRKIHERGVQAGIALNIEEPAELLEPMWKELDIVTIVGTKIGIKGAGMDPCVPEKIRAARRLNQKLGCRVEIECDGGIRRNTVPLMHAAGADFIVPGSLMFGEDPAAMRQWLASL